MWQIRTTDSNTLVFLCAKKLRSDRVTIIFTRVFKSLGKISTKMEAGEKVVKNFHFFHDSIILICEKVIKRNEILIKNRKVANSSSQFHHSNPLYKNKRNERNKQKAW